MKGIRRRSRISQRIDVDSDGDDADIPPKWIRRIARTVLKGERWEAEGRIQIVLADDATLQQLNLRYLNRDRPTDVIAFNLGDEVFGEIYVGYQRAREQAVDYGVTYNEELAKLVTHGILHLMGYDDFQDDAGKKMDEIEQHYLNVFKSKHLL